jgi:hypothetical protein
MGKPRGPNPNTDPQQLLQKQQCCESGMFIPDPKPAIKERGEEK